MHHLPHSLAAQSLFAFVAGILSFLSPCVLPLVPGYVSIISGASVEELRSSTSPMRRTVLLHSLMFIVGFSLVFVALGATATVIGTWLGAWRIWLTRILGIIVIIFGLHLTGLIKINALYADKRLHNLKGGATAFGPLVVGFAFAFGWTPCVGPILSPIFGFAMEQSTVWRGVFLLAVYSMGLAVPFLLTSLGVDRFLAFYGRFRRHLHTVEVCSGILLIAIGVLIFMNNLTWLSSHLTFLNRFAL